MDAALRARLPIPRIEFGVGRIRSGETAIELFDVITALGRSLGTPDEDVDALLEALEDEPITTEILTLEWGGLGPTSSSLDIGILRLGGADAYVCTRDEVIGTQVWVLLEPLCAETLGEFLGSLDQYAQWLDSPLIVALPSKTTNHRPDLASAATVKVAYRNWLDADSTHQRWAAVRAEVSLATERRKGGSHREAPAAGAGQHAGGGSADWSRVSFGAVPPLTDGQRTTLLDAYFAGAYRQ